jgi:hypothetical protein
VEGAEHFVLRGASRLCKAKCFDYIIAEYLPEIAGTSTKAIDSEFSVLEAIGYQACAIANDGGLIPFANARFAVANRSTRSVVFRAQR